MAREYIKTGEDEYTPIGDTQSFPDLRDNYSTDEVRVGTWIDGKPVYKKTFKDTAPLTVTTPGWIVIATNLGFKQIISCDGFFMSQNNFYWQQYGSDLNTPQRVRLVQPMSTNNGELQIYVSTYVNAAMVADTGYVTLYYTKITD
jgi:hypothetical protein